MSVIRNSRVDCVIILMSERQMYLSGFYWVLGLVTLFKGLDTLFQVFKFFKYLFVTGNKYYLDFQKLVFDI